VAAPVVVILAAGQGTRMRSDTPKLLHPLCGRPIIEWTIDAARQAGARRVVLVDSPQRRLEGLCAAPGAGGAGDGEDRTDTNSVEVVLAVQEEPRGTADAVRAAVPHLRDAGSDPVVVIAGDAPLVSADSLKALVDSHQRTNSGATIATMILEDPSGYGRIVRAPDGTVERVVETKAAGDATELELHIREVNTGMFAFDADALISALDDVRADNAQGEYYLPDVIPALRARERTVDAHELAEPAELLGINDRVQLAEVAAIAQRRIAESHMRAGVTIVNPAATVIDHGVRIGRDSVIAPFTCLHGTTQIGEHVSIGSNTTLIDATIQDGASVLSSHIVGATVGPRATVGPFAYLRPGTVLRERAKAGTFVEIKNSDVGAGSKVPHLSYVGDADIGENVNLGASTITANYDGYRKHRTTIGHRVKTSVHTTLVAPISLGDEAYTAAGSALTHTVPAGALAVARPRQMNIEGYAQRRRERADAESEATAGGGRAPAAPPEPGPAQPAAAPPEPAATSQPAPAPPQPAVPPDPTAQPSSTADRP
jgi:bifunctional UDP-N-acetylglucosamine pyrophosphorylase/glucosamine-1-phosphate N-acetyltransferase